MEIPFKIGNTIRILERPDSWSDKAGGKPGLYKVKYPYVCDIMGMAAGLSNIGFLDNNGYGWCYKEENKHLFELVSTQADEEPNMQELLEEAKRRYPVGTKYYSAYDPTLLLNIVQSDWKWEIRGKNISNQYGNYIYYNNKWAEIVELPKEKEVKDHVNCKTQEQWDFVTKKLGYKWEYGEWESYRTCINLEYKAYSPNITFDENKYYTFQEWLDLNGYTFEEEFKVGDWVITDNKMYCSSNIAKQVINIEKNNIYISSSGWWYKKDTRKATPEEIASVTKELHTPEENKQCIYGVDPATEIRCGKGIYEYMNMSPKNHKFDAIVPKINKGIWEQFNATLSKVQYNYFIKKYYEKENILEVDTSEVVVKRTPVKTINKLM